MTPAGAALDPLWAGAPDPPADADRHSFGGLGFAVQVTDSADDPRSVPFRPQRGYRPLVTHVAARGRR